MPREMDEAMDQEIERIEQGGNAWEDSEAIELEVRQPLDKVVPVRLSSNVWNEMRRAAREIGVGPSTLARMWILEKLREVSRKQNTA